MSRDKKHRIVLLSKTNEWSLRAGQIAGAIFGDQLISFSGNVGDPAPAALVELQPDWLLSFLSPWIVPAPILERSGNAINFHPASREYPGIGCYNFALYEGAQQYGAVCHHMHAKVDTGDLIAETRFPLFPSDTVETLKLRTLVAMLSLFHDIVGIIASGQPLPRMQAGWSRKPFTRRQLNELTCVTPEMPTEEVARRIRATSYPGYPGPEVNISGFAFQYPVPSRRPLA